MSLLKALREFFLKTKMRLSETKHELAQCVASVSILFNYGLMICALEGIY